MHILALCVLILLILNTAIRFYLGGRHIRHILQHRDAVPAAFANHIDLAAHQKAADYSIANKKLGLLEVLVDVAVVVALLYTGALAWFDTVIGGWGLGQTFGGAVTIILVMMATSVITLPMSLYRTFVHEEKFGFNRTTLGTFFGDMIKGVILSLVLLLPLLMFVLWLYNSAGSFWWLWAWAAWSAFSLFLVWAFPRFIAPLFNTFEPLEDADLKSRIDNLLARCGFSANGVFVMDGSKRSAHGNAYFTGMGENKRIVFFDTLLEGMEPHEVEAVLAHELGHFKRKHIQKGMIASLVTSLVGFALLGWVSSTEWFYAAFGVSQSAHMALLLFIFLLPIFTFLLGPLGSRRSRKHEFEADEFAVEQTNGKDLISALVKLYKENASTLTPDPLHSLFYDSHPPAPLRVAHINQHMQATS